ncbi:phosphate ABC transporter substrate-binding protein [Clostridium cadaveris]|uniref:phosphate ABC transporter substrate-binding protein n=1 Tax=Clostridium cadaveris TaxID=1529 RepID=UPI0039A3EC6F
MNKRVKRLCMVLAVAALGTSFAACGAKNEGADGSDKISGDILAVGSTALQPLAEKTGKMFTEKYPDVTISVQGGGSGVGITQVSEGSVQIGNSDVEAKKKISDENVLKELVNNKVCAIGFALVVNKDVAVENLTTEQIQDIFTGKVTNWKEVGGSDLPINVVNRSKSSGTRATFKDTILKDKDEKEGLGLTQDSTSAAKKTVKDTSGAISYVALSNLRNDSEKEGLKLLKINGVDPTTENISSNKYPFWAYEYMITKGEPKGAVKAYIDYITSDETKDTIIKEGYIPMSEFK